MGRPKQLLDFNGTPLVTHVTREALRAEIGTVLVVVGGEAEAVRHTIEGLPIRIIENKRWSDGMASSIKAAVLECLDYESILLTLCDTPYVTAEHLREVATALDDPAVDAVGTAYENVVGVPAAFRRAQFKLLLELLGDQGARELLRSSDLNIASVRFERAALDFDWEE
jgi:molybdenum cofactor cytidylyltransferase